MDALDALKVAEEKTEVSTALEQSGLDQDAFLTIFLAQLENQDPLNPQEADQLAAQLAQFSQLEQSIRSTGQLTGVNERLDRLIEAQSGQSAFRLDPVALLGREVDIGYKLPAIGESTPLRMELEEASSVLRLEARDRDGNRLGLAEIQGTDEAGEIIDLPAGTYQLIFDNGSPRIIVPSGTETSIDFHVFQSGSDRIDPGAPPVSFESGTIYQFGVVAEGIDRGPYSPRTNMTGSVDGVRFVGGQPVLSVSGTDVDPSQILRIR